MLLILGTPKDVFKPCQPPASLDSDPKIKSDTVSTVSPSICHEVMGPDAMILVF